MHEGRYYYMNPIDNMLAESIHLEFKLRHSKIVPNVKKRLKQIFKISLEEAIKDFDKFDYVLRDVQGKKSEQIKKKDHQFIVQY